MPYCCIERHLNEAGALWCTDCGSLVEGARIGDYRLVSYIGNGSAADVYLAEQYSLSRRRVVIKIMHCSWGESYIGRFEREAAVLAALSHPYILPIFSYGVLYKRPYGEQAAQNNCLPYLVLPYAEQGSLAEIFEREGKRPWPLARVVTMAKEIAEALDYAHAQGVIHRDVKPANILYVGSHALLCDFSVASPIDADVSHLNVPWAGSPAYMAPEVWQQRPGRYSDQYALAVSCFFLLTGQLPLSKSGDARTHSWSNLHCFVAPRSILECRQDLPLAVNAVLQRALSKDPHDRYTTVEAFASDLFDASQDITQQIGAFPGRQESGNRVAWPVLIGTQVYGKEERNIQREAVKVGEYIAKQPVSSPPVFSAPGFNVPAPANAGAGSVFRLPDSQTDSVLAYGSGSREGMINRAPTPVTADPKGGFISDVSTEALASVEYKDRWVWSALLLNLLVCLALAAEYGWQMGNTMGYWTAAVYMLLVIWPALLVGPLLARVFRRFVFPPPSSLSWGLFWGVFYGLTDALLSVFVCLVWTMLVFLPNYYICPPWCKPGDGFSVVSNQIIGLVQQAVLPIVLGLWIAVIGGAIIGIMHMRYR